MKHREPVAVITAVTPLIEAAIALAVGFGLNLTAEQVGLIMALIVAAGNLVNTLWARAHVTRLLARVMQTTDLWFQRNLEPKGSCLTPAGQHLSLCQLRGF